MTSPHRVEIAAARLPGERDVRYRASCSCGWKAEPCATPVLAEAAAEQHLTLVSTRQP